jgi:hypothetical protein
MTYEQAKTRRDALEAAVKAIKFPDGTNGNGRITPDHVKFSPEYKAAKEAFNAAFAELRSFNEWYVKTFRDAIRDERRSVVLTRRNGR